MDVGQMSLVPFGVCSLRVAVMSSPGSFSPIASCVSFAVGGGFAQPKALTCNVGGRDLSLLLRGPGP